MGLLKKLFKREKGTAYVYHADMKYKDTGNRTERTQLIFPKQITESVAQKEFERLGGGKQNVTISRIKKVR